MVKTSNIVTEKLLQILEALCSDERNNVYILSGMPKSLIDKWYSSVRRLGLAAEYGYHYRLSTEEAWRVAKLQQSDGWKADTMRLYQWFTERTDGSDIEVKDNSLVWIYKNCDPEFGQWQADDLQQELTTVLAGYPHITILHGKGFIDVKPKELEKGELAWEIIEDVRRKKGSVDFVLCVGDDVEDEEMFKRIKTVRMDEDKTDLGVNKEYAKFTCTVGKKPSHAEFYLNDHLDTVDLLKDMASWSIKVRDRQRLPRE